MSEDDKFFPRLKTLPNIPAPSCVLPFLCRLGPILQDYLIVTFDGKFILLNFSYLAKKDLRQVMSHIVVSPFALTIFSFYTYLLHLRLLPPNILFITTPPN